MVELRAPKVNTNDDQMEIGHWYIDDGAFIEKGANLVDLATSKAIVTVPAESSGYVKRHYEKNSVIKVGEILASFYENKEQIPSGVKNEKKAPPPPATQKGTHGFARFSNEALAYLKEKGLDPATFEGRGLVTKRSLENFGKPVPAPSAPAAVPVTPSISLPASARKEKIPMAKRVEISSLTQGQSGNIISSLTVEFETESVHKALIQRRSFDGNLQPIVLYETALALKKRPKFTAFFADDHFHFYDTVNVGVALDLGKGLTVPVMKNMDQSLPAHIHRWLLECGMKYLRKALKPEDFMDGTFTITDLSGKGIRAFQPLVNQFQAAILGIGGDMKAKGRPLSLTLSFDHRVLTGMEVAEFLSELRENILSYGAPA